MPNEFLNKMLTHHFPKCCQNLQMKVFFLTICEVCLLKAVLLPHGSMTAISNPNIIPHSFNSKMQLSFFSSSYFIIFVNYVKSFFQCLKKSQTSFRIFNTKSLDLILKNAGFSNEASCTCFSGVF